VDLSNYRYFCQVGFECCEHAEEWSIELTQAYAVDVYTFCRSFIRCPHNPHNWHQ